MLQLGVSHHHTHLFTFLLTKPILLYLLRYYLTSIFVYITNTLKLIKTTTHCHFNLSLMNPIFIPL